MMHKIALFALTTSLAAASSAQTSYDVTHLGAPEGATEVRATAMNADGHVVGFTIDPGNQARPVVWIDGTMTLLSVPDGFPGAVPTGISDAGVVCGNAFSHGSFGLANALMWRSVESEPVLLPTLGGPNSGAYGVSPDGEVIVGWSYAAGGTTAIRAFRFHLETNAIENIGLPPDNGVTSAHGAAINAQRQVVASTAGVQSVTRSFIDDPIEGKIDIGSFGGLKTVAAAIGDNGHVVGHAETGKINDATQDLAAHAFLWHGGRMTDLGTLDGFIESRALGVNSSATVVGTSFNQPFFGFPRRAFVWSDGEMTDLNDLIPLDTGWELQQAAAINDAGQIAGWGLLNGQRRAFLLTPAR